MDKLILTGQYAFQFRPLPNTIRSKYEFKLTNNVTLTSAKKTDEAKKVEDKAVIALPPPEAADPKPEENKT